MILTALAVFFVAQNEINQRRAEFVATVQQIEESIRSRMDSYVTLLRGGTAFAGTRDLDLQRFTAYVSRLRITANYPGVQGIGFSLRVPAENKDVVEARIARERGGDFHIWPDGARDEYHTVAYIEPMDRRNSRAIGFDMATDPVRKEAMDRARDEAAPISSGRVRLVQEGIGPAQNGFLIYAPVYRGDVTSSTVEERRAKLTGYIYSPFRVGDLMEGVIGKGISTRIVLRLYDGDISNEHLLHTMNTLGRDEMPFMHRPFRDVNEMQVAGRRWTLVWESAPMFLGGAMRSGTILVALIGTILSGFLYQSVAAERRTRAGLEANAAALLKEQVLLRLSEERFRLFMERAREYAIVLVDNDGRISSWNPGAERTFGYDSSIIGQPLAVIFPPEDRAAHVAEQQIVAARDHGSFVDERWHVRKDGSRFWATGALISLRSEGAAHHGYVKILRDMTVRKENEEAIRLLNHQLEERVRTRTAAVQELNAQMEAFTYTVVHDLRAPLRAMHGFSTALMDDYGQHLDSTAREFLTRITQAAERMDALIQDLLDLSHVSRADIRFATVDLNAVVRGTLEELDGEIKKSAAQITVREPLPEVFAEFKILQRILNNLLTNALKFTRQDTAPVIKIFAEPREDRIRVCVQDNGMGIHTEHQQRIFRVFERLHGYGTYPGTGMGLAIVKRSVERLGGAVGVTSEPGRGSTFWFEVPAVPKVDGV